MSKFTLYMVRHGQTYFNIYNKLQGWSNSPLTDKGMQNAVDTGEKLKNTKFAAAYCSDTTRAEQTAQKILDENQVSNIKRQQPQCFSEKSSMDTSKEMTWIRLGI